MMQEKRYLAKREHKMDYRQKGVEFLTIIKRILC